jgi:short-subunit dehydrogenase
VAYCASKSALDSISEGCRRELRREGIHVATVRPCIVRTGFRKHVLAGSPPERVQEMAGAISAERVAAAVIRTCERRIRLLPLPVWQYYPFVLLERLAPRVMDRYLERQWIG